MKPALSFKNTDNYISTNIGSCFTFFATNSFSREELSETGNIKNIHYGDIHTKFSNILDISNIELPCIKNIKLLKKYENCQNYDLIMADASENYNDIGKSVQLLNVNANVVAGLHTLMLRPFKKSLYFVWLFQSWYVRHQIMKFAVGTKVLGISKETLKKVKIYLPSLPEQDKIATFLNLYYKKIELQKKKIDFLEKIKNIKLNIIFSNLEMPKMKLKNYIVQISDRNKHNEELPVLSVSNKFGFIPQNEQFEEEVASEDKSAYKKICKNEFAYNPARINVGSVALLKSFNKGIVSPMYICFKCCNGINIDFLNHYLKSNNFKREMSKRLEGSVRMCLSFESLCNIPVLILTEEKQEEIINILNLIDKKLKLEKNKYELMEKYKKGLLQQMFV